jgi:hypothetical protein
MKCVMALGMLLLMTGTSWADANASRFRIENGKIVVAQIIAACVPTAGHPANSAATAREPAFRHAMVNTETAARKIADRGQDNSPRF